jgi:hypothetical protein
LVQCLNQRGHEALQILSRFRGRGGGRGRGRTGAGDTVGRCGRTAKALLTLAGDTRCCNVFRMFCIKLPPPDPDVLVSALLELVLEELEFAPNRLEIAF